MFQVDVYWDDQDPFNSGWAWSSPHGSGPVEVEGSIDNPATSPVELAVEAGREAWRPEPYRVVVQHPTDQSVGEVLSADIPTTFQLAKALLKTDLENRSRDEVRDLIRKAGGFRAYVNVSKIVAGTAGDDALVVAIEVRGIYDIGEEVQCIVEGWEG